MLLVQDKQSNLGSELNCSSIILLSRVMATSKVPRGLSVVLQEGTPTNLSPDVFMTEGLSIQLFCPSKYTILECEHEETIFLVLSLVLSLRYQAHHQTPVSDLDRETVLV